MKRYGYSIFCDDIKNEDGGKLSFIGCYNGVMFVTAGFPTSLRRFCIHLSVRSPATMPFTSLLVRCYIPNVDMPIIEEIVRPPERDHQIGLVTQLAGAPEVPRHIVAATSLVFAPLSITGPGLISVRALVDDDPEELRLGSLQVTQAYREDRMATRS